MTFLSFLKSIFLAVIIVCTLTAGKSQAACTNGYGPEVTIIPRSETTFSFYYRDLDSPTSHEFRLERTGVGRGYYNVRITWDFTFTLGVGHYNVYLVGVNSCGNRNTNPMLVWSR